MNEREKHPLSGKTFLINSKDPALDGKEFLLEDWQLNLHDGIEWGEMLSNAACLIYAIHCGCLDLPDDDRVIGGKVDGLSVLIHETELGQEIVPSNIWIEKDRR